MGVAGRKSTGVVLLLCACVAGCTSEPPKPEPISFTTQVTRPVTSIPPITDPGAPSAVPAACESYLAQFGSDKAKLAELLTVGVTSKSDAVSVVEDYQVGGIFLGSGTSEGLVGKDALDEVKAKRTGPGTLMVTIDEEGGRVSRFPDLFDDGRGLAARDVADTKSVDDARSYMLKRAQVLAAAGVTVDFAPVVDVGENNAAIGDRSFADDPQKVTDYARAYVQALTEANVGAVLKHFPGHGSASGDSHTGAVTTPELSQLLAVDLVPYQQLANSGAAVMVGHLVVPDVTEVVDGVSLPASLSPKIMSMLRDGTYGGPAFDGVIFTDDLSGMAAVTDEFTTPQAAAMALEAGADVALWISTDAVPAVLAHLEDEVADGNLAMADVDQKVLRIGRFKKATPPGC